MRDDIVVRGWMLRLPDVLTATEMAKFKKIGYDKAFLDEQFAEAEDAEEFFDWLKNDIFETYHDLFEEDEE